MGDSDGAPTRILASHLYDFAVCEHRIALDVRLDRSLRTPPDAAMRLLRENGRRFEERIARELGYPEVKVEGGDFERAAAETLELMRSGVPGIYQGVLLDGRFLAQADLLERAEGPSSLGGFHYVAGDVKSAVAARSDAALQVAFAASLLERIQARAPSEGFLILGDGSREWFDPASIRRSFLDAMERVTEVADRAGATFSFFSRHCARCRWRDECLPGMLRERDLSLVHGLTRTRHRVFRRHGIMTIEDLSRADRGALERAGAPTDGLDRLKRQALALIEGKPEGRRAVKLAAGTRREYYLRIEADPLDPGDPFLFAWGSGAAAGGELERSGAALGGGPAERERALRALLEALDAGDCREPIYHFGGATPRAFDAAGEALSLEPALLGGLEGRMVDLAPAVRRAAALPVHLYRFDEVAAVIRGEPCPPPDVPEDALFVEFAGSREADDPAPHRDRLMAAGAAAVQSLHAIRRWLEGAP
jgi:predicted RecB family nuclease